MLQVAAIGRNALFALPVIVLYYQNQIGLSFQEFILGEVFFAAVVIAMEVPSGWIADVTQRRIVLAWSMFFVALGWCMLLVADGFWLAAMSQGVIGIGVSLFSGTDSALLYDSLAEDGKTDEFRRLAGLQSAVSFYALAVASLVGGFMYSVDPYLPVYGVLAAVMVALVAVLRLREPARVRHSVERHPLHDMAVTIREAVFRNRAIGLVVLGAAVVFGSTQYNTWAQQAYWQAFAVPPALNGVLAALGWGLAGVAGHYGHWVERKMGYRRSVLLIWLVLCASWLVAGLSLSWAGVGLLFAGSMSWALGWPAVQDAINRQIDGSRRATVISAVSLAIRLAFMPIGVALSWVADHHGIQPSLLILGGVHAGLGVIALLVARRLKLS